MKTRLQRLYGFLDSGLLKVKVLPDEAFGLVHGKAGVITRADGSQVCFIGSANESRTAWVSNYELVWLDESEDGVRWVQEEFGSLQPCGTKRRPNGSSTPCRNVTPSKCATSGLKTWTGSRAVGFWIRPASWRLCGKGGETSHEHGSRCEKGWNCVRDRLAKTACLA
jgi:hypothetical protein